MQDAGAAAIELNIYYLPGDPEISGRDVEQRHVDVLERVKSAVSVPVAVKLSPYFSSAGEMALRLDQAGADALVLFNRFLQPDIDTEQLVVLPRVNLSSPADARLARTWIALLRGRSDGLARRHLGRGGARRPCPISARGRRRGDDDVRAAAPRSGLRNRPPRRPAPLDGEQGLPDGGRRSRPARGAASTPTPPRMSVQVTSLQCAPPMRAPTTPGE